VGARTWKEKQPECPSCQPCERDIGRPRFGA
jgi:hypothetical protein